MQNDTKLFSIGAAAFLTPGGSVHRESFIRAVNMAVMHHAAENDTALLWENDGASLEGGRGAAQALVKKEVQLVVGHYATAAALGALPVYGKAGVPLLLPAATADDLTTRFSNAFRVCRSDSALAAFTCNMIGHISRCSRIAVANDHSMHGRYLAQAATAVLADRNQLGDLNGGHDAVIFAGMFSSSMAFLRQYRSREPVRPLYFTDDAVHRDIIDHARGLEHNLYIAGYAPAHWYPNAQMLTHEYFQLANTWPPTYYLETYAAMQIAIACKDIAQHKLLQILETGEWPTVLGNIRFVNRESNCSRFTIWHITGERLLQPLQNLPAYA